MARALFSTQIGFILAAVGAAVGLGSLWRFPYLASTNGGATFVVLYTLLLLLIGIPALLAEFCLGRRSRRNAVDAFAGDGGTPRWRLGGVLSVTGAVVLLSYYSVIAGWALRYLLDAVLGLGSRPAFFPDADAYFLAVAEGPAAVGAHFAFLAMTALIVAFGVAKGIERANRFMMPALFLVILGLAVYANTLGGSAAGRAFYLQPDLGQVTASSVSAAAGQTYFSLGLGMAIMLTYAGYLSRDADLKRTAVAIAVPLLVVAFLAGLMVFPLIFSLGLEHLVAPGAESTVGGLFIILPTAFAAMGDALGPGMAAVFFLMVAFAAFTSSVSLLEAPVSMVLDRRPHWGRRRAVLLVATPIYTLGLLSALRLEFLDLADAFASRILFLVAGLVLVIYVGWVRPQVLEELGGGRMAEALRPYIRYVLPLPLTALLGLGVVGFLGDIGILG